MLVFSCHHSTIFSHRRRLTVRITELEDTLDQLRSRNASLEKAKTKLTNEIRELTIDLENVSICGTHEVLLLKNRQSCMRYVYVKYILLGTLYVCILDSFIFKGFAAIFM